MGAGLQFQLRPEYYATLTLESLVVAALQPTGNGSLIQPPFPQPVLDLSQAGQPLQSIQGQASDQQIQTLQQFGQQTSSAKISKPWLQWFWAVYRWITAGSAGGSNYLEVIAPSIDETDIGWFGNGTVNNTSDPVSFTATLTGFSRFGLQVEPVKVGTGYSGSVTVTIKDANGNTNGAAVTGVIAGGGVVQYIVTNPGYGLVPPLTVTITGGGGSGATATATLGRQWAVGDYIIWNDPTITSSAYQYEIDQIAAITYISSTSATFKLTRHAPGAASGFAQFGSQIAAHTDANFYRLINKGWLFPFDSTLGPQLVKLLWDNMTVAAVTVGQTGQTPIVINLAPLPYLPGTTTPNPRLTPPAPGMRTMNGAAYTTLGLSGQLIAGATSAARISAQAWESVRTIYAKVQTAPAGATSFGGDANACIVIWVCYLSPPNTSGVRTVGLLDCLVIDAGNFTSYVDTNSVTPAPNVPDGRQMPYHALSQWTRTAPFTDWPPNYLPTLAGALNASGGLQLGTAPNLPNPPSGTASVQFTPDGQIDFIIGQVGASTAGANLVVTVQT